MVEVSLTVGKLDASLALLLTKEHHLIEFPTVLLPSDVEAGSIVRISCERDKAKENQDSEVFGSIQDQILSTFGTNTPQEPVLRVRNVTQTSVVLEWDPVDTATAEIISLTLFKNGERFGVIPNPLKRTATKLSGLQIDSSHSFYLVLSTTGGTFKSNEITVKTHKMTDLSGITICVGNLDESEVDRADLEETVKKIGAKPLQDYVRLDTTHFICTVGEGPHWKRAQDLNIPVVRPEWIKACEAERRLVGVRAYYLNADPKLRPPVHRPRASSYGTQISAELGAPSTASIPIESGTASPTSGNVGTSNSRHQRAVSEIQDAPFPVVAASIPSTAPVIEESEAEAAAEAEDSVNNSRQGVPSANESNIDPAHTAESTTPKADSPVAVPVEAEEEKDEPSKTADEAEEKKDDDQFESVSLDDTKKSEEKEDLQEDTIPEVSVTTPSGEELTEESVNIQEPSEAVPESSVEPVEESAASVHDKEEDREVIEAEKKDEEAEEEITEPAEEKEEEITEPAEEKEEEITEPAEEKEEEITEPAEEKEEEITEPAEEKEEESPAPEGDALGSVEEKDDTPSSAGSTKEDELDDVQL